MLNTHRETSYCVIMNLNYQQSIKMEGKFFKRKWYLGSIIKLCAIIILLSKSVWSILLLYQDMIHKFIHSFKKQLCNEYCVSAFLLGIRVFIHFYFTNICCVSTVYQILFRILGREERCNSVFSYRETRVGRGERQVNSYILCNCFLEVRSGCQGTSKTYRKNNKIMAETEGPRAHSHLSRIFLQILLNVCYDSGIA